MSPFAPDPSFVLLRGRHIHRAWIILIGCCFLQAGVLGNVLTSSGVFFVPVCDDLGFKRAELSLFITAYFVAGAFAFPLAGKILATYSFRTVVSVCAAVCALATMLMGTYTQVWQWVVTGLVYGTFGCCVFMLPYSVMISNWFKKKAGFAMGVASCSAALSSALFLPLYATLIEVIGWRSTYLVQGIIVALFVLPWSLTTFYGKPADIGARPYGWERNNGVASAAEIKLQPVPGVPARKAVTSVAFVMCFLFGGISVWIGSGFDSHLPGFAVSIGFDATAAALLSSALQIGSFCDKLLMGFLNDRFGVIKTIYIELVVVFIGVLGLIYLREYRLLLLAAFLFGVQDSLNAVSVPLLIRQLFGNKNYTQIFSYVRIGCSIFGAIASVSVGFIYDSTGSFVPAFYAVLVACVVGAVAVACAYLTRKALAWEDVPEDLTQKARVQALDE